MAKRTIYRDKLTRQRVSQQDDDTAQPQQNKQTFGTKGSTYGFFSLPALKMKIPEPGGGRYIETDPKNKMRFV